MTNRLSALRYLCVVLPCRESNCLQMLELMESRYPDNKKILLNESVIYFMSFALRAVQPDIANTYLD